MTIREQRPFVVFGFDSTHDALDAEELLEQGGFEVVVVPAPAVLSARCGISLRVALDVAESARLHLVGAGTSPTSQVEIRDI